jgi:hypothetical protein
MNWQEELEADSTCGWQQSGGLFNLVQDKAQLIRCILARASTLLATICSIHHLCRMWNWGACR